MAAAFLIAVSYLISAVLCSPNPRSIDSLNNAGRVFIITFADNTPPPRPSLTIHAYLSEDPVNCTLTSYLGDTTSHLQVQVTGSDDFITLSEDLIIKYLKGESMLARKSLHIVCDLEVVIYTFSLAMFSTDAYTAIPVDVLGTEYFVPSSKRTMYDVSPTIVVTATCVEITEMELVFPEMMEYYHPVDCEMTNGTGFTVRLQRFETVALQARDDLSGTQVLSSCPVAVLSGNKRGASAEGLTGDHQIEMITPISTWGSQYLTTPLYGRTKGDYFTIIGSQQNTNCTLTISDNFTSSIEGVIVNSYYGMELPSNAYMIVKCQHSVMVVQYAKSATKGNRYSDPFMMLIPSLNQYDSQYTVSTMQPSGPRVDKSLFDQYISIIIPDNQQSELLIDGKPLITADSTGGRFHIVRNESISGMNYTNLVLKVKHGTYSLRLPDPTETFGVTVYGHRLADSYGYPGGFRMHPTGYKESVLAYGKERKFGQTEGEPDNDTPLIIGLTFLAVIGVTGLLIVAAIRYRKKRQRRQLEHRDTNTMNPVSPSDHE